MRRGLAWTVILTFLVLVISCAKEPRLEGLWQDASSYTEFEIEKSGDGYEMTSIVDVDGEVFELRDFEWSCGVMRFTYWVPSTDYIVSFKTLEIHEDSMRCKWWGTGGDGLETLLRLD
jgi:hypothetical protein